MLIETKLHTPAVREEWVRREELVDYLAGLTAKLVLVDAPAGFGKTTLIAQWQQRPGESRPFAWVSLDPGDNDPGRLWWHVACALQRACQWAGVGDVVAPAPVPWTDIAETLLSLLINGLAKLAQPVVLVLDDYHVISERDCHNQLAFLLQHLPPTVQIVLITRADPPLPLARLRVTAELAEIRAPELRFTGPQAAQLIASVAGVELSPPDLADLVDLTEGWPAAIYLAALSLRGRASPREVVRQFSGDTRIVEDFLAEEVLSRQPVEVRRFLARTSILGRFCAPLCDAVTGSADAAEIIDVIERQNLFIVPLDDARRWFRYHHLFAQMLRSDLSRSEPEIVSTLHKRASAWHRQSGSADEAISHAYAAGDIGGVIDLMAQHWHAYVDSGRVSTVHSWLGLLGDDIIRADAAAAHCAAWAAALSGDQESLRHWLPIIEASEDERALPDGIRSLRSSAALLEGTFGFRGIGPMRNAAARAVSLESEPGSPWRALAQASCAAALYWSGDLDAAATVARNASPGATSIPLIRLWMCAVLTLIAVDQGDAAEAERWARTAQEIVASADSRLSEAPQSSLAFTAFGAVAAQRGQLTEARRALERALEIRHQNRVISPWVTLEVLLRLAPVLARLGDEPGAAALLAEARSILESSPDGAEAQFARLAKAERRLAGRPRTLSPGAPLTDREAAVLRLLRGSLSLREIGEQLYLSQNTIKTHTRAIYRKLGVSSRDDAISRGHDIDIL